MKLTIEITMDERILVHASEFSPEQMFRSLQQAIDHFNRYMPEDLR